MHDPLVAPRLEGAGLTKEAYASARHTMTTLNHFEEKLFKLKVEGRASARGCGCGCGWV